MAVIKVLDEILSNKIAAGEVVERCSSVVKELVENSIDAFSTEIKVELLESGTKEIKVIDNGKGMDSEDAIKCFERHATSKISREEDLYRIGTLGFRGEALASIASVSKVTLNTSTGEIGTSVEINGGRVVEVKKGDARKGTIITVSDLFYNTPARLKHLKSLYTELASITDYMNKLALSHPEIRFSLSNDNKVIFSTDGSSNLLKTIKDVYGVETTKKMVLVKGENSDYQIEGYISLPEIHKSNRNSIVTLVNGRIVRNSELNRSINDAYHSYKPDNRYPVVVLNIKVDTSIVDVNIHPTKMDIKFGKQEELNELVIKMIKEVIGKKTLIPNITEPKEGLKSNKQVEYETFTLNFDDIKEPDTEIIINKDFIDNDEIEIHEDVVEKLPLMYPIGLVHGTYIICQNEIGMYLIDQHAAKERINYEKVKENLFSNNKESISMLFPVTLEYPINEYIILKENIEFLETLNFNIEEFGMNSIIVKSHPTWLPRDLEEENIRKIFEMVINKEKNFDLKRFYDHLSSTVACKMSIKANTNITVEEMQYLIDDLRKCENPFNCPHGRPTVIYYSKTDLEKLFKRSGF
jgi:DNA mismatch repair protein MutL